MKKNLIKKVFAVSLSIAMACSLIPAANPVTASAAAPYVSLKTTFKTLKVGQKYKMTLKNNTINWKIKKVETTDKTICTVYGKTTSSVMLKGKSEGRATIRVKLATTKRKKNNTKTLRCRAKVVTTTPAPVDPGTTTQTDATVTTQQELTDALAKSGITKITIKPAGAVNFTIPTGTYNNVDLIVDAPQSEIENSATFKSITVKNIKSSTWTEKGTGNAFNWKAANGRLVVGKGASVKNIAIPTASAKVAIDVQEGTIGAITVSAKLDLTITGKLATGAPAISISFTASATDATLSTAIKAAVSTASKIAATFLAGAEDSTIKLETTGISVAVTNNTTKAIVVTRNNNTTMNVAVGAKGQTVSSAASNSGSGTWTPGTGSGSGSGTVKPMSSNLINTASAIKVKINSGSALITEGHSTVSSGSITYSIKNVRAVSAGAIEYRVVTDYGYYGSWKSMTRGEETDTKGVYYYSVTNDSISLEGANVNGGTLKFQFRVAADSANSAGKESQAEVSFTIEDGKVAVDSDFKEVSFNK